MRKRLIAFYDLLLYAIMCGPLVVIAVVLLFLLVIQGTPEWIFDYWYLVVSFAISFMLPIGGAMLLRYCEMNINSIHFYYFTYANSWKHARNNIDIRWNQEVIVSEIKDVEIVKLSEEEKQTKVYYKHWFNKYLKINLKHGGSKYVYVGNYSGCQIKKLIMFMKNQCE